MRLLNLVFICFLLTSYSFSQKLYIPISDPEVLKIYKSGEKLSDGEYVSKDKEGNIRVKGRFDKITPIGKWYIFFKNGNLMAYYNYNDQGELDGIFVEYYDNSQLKISGYFKENLQTKLWQTFLYGPDHHHFSQETHLLDFMIQTYHFKQMQTKLQIGV